MSRAAIAVLAALAAAPSRAAAPPGHVDPDAIREVRREAAPRFASARAISHYLEARRLARSGDAAGAAEQLRVAVAHDEQSPELRTALAEVLASSGRLDDAEAEARRAVELAGAGPTASEAQVLLGRIAAARDRIDEAALAFRAAIRLQAERAAAGAPADPEPWRLLATLYAGAGEEDAAARTLEDLAAHVPGDGSGFRELGRALLDAGQPGRAERHLRRALQLGPRDVEALRLLARAHEALRREPEAREDLLAILRLEPDDGPALLVLGRMAARAGDLAAAREWFGRHVEASGGDADAHVRVVFQWLEGGRGAEALAAARAGIAAAGPDPRLRLAQGLALAELRRWAEAANALAAIRPEAGDLFVSARAALAEALSRAGRHRDAERALEAPLATHPGEVRLLLVRAAVLDRAGRALDSVALLRRGIAERERAGDDAELPDLYAALGESLARAGRASEAVKVLGAALARRPRDESLLYALGAAYERAGESRAAVAQMRALLVVNPDHAEALNFVGYLYAEEGVRLDEAERLVRRALELRPRSGHMLDSLGWVRFRRGDHRAAVELLEQADALAGPDATILEHLGDAYRAAARPGEAVKAYRRALASVSREVPSERGRRRAAIERKLRELSDRPRRR